MEITKQSAVRLMPNQFAYFGDVRLPFRVVPDGLEFCVKESWLRGEYGRVVVVTWDEIERLRGVPLT